MIIYKQRFNYQPAKVQLNAVWLAFSIMAQNSMCCSDIFMAEKNNNRGIYL